MKVVIQINYKMKNFPTNPATRASILCSENEDFDKNIDKITSDLSFESSNIIYQI